MDVLVVYDVNTEERAGQRRLRKVAAICEKYGVRVQKSVFECRLPQSHLQRLANDLMQYIDPRVDSIYIYRFEGDIKESRSTFGVGVPREPGDPWVV